jgi:hypothetical protein
VIGKKYLEMREHKKAMSWFMLGTWIPLYTRPNKVNLHLAEDLGKTRESKPDIRPMTPVLEELYS